MDDTNRRSVTPTEGLDDKMSTLSLSEGVEALSLRDDKSEPPSEGSQQLQDTIEIRGLASDTKTVDTLVKDADTNTARQMVFAFSDLNEVLANVLVHLTPQTIFGVQRVSKSFVNATKKSPEIQEKLFLRQRDPGQGHTLHDGSSTAGYVSPFFVGAGGRNWHLGTAVGESTRARIRSEQSSILDTFAFDSPRGVILWQIQSQSNEGGIIMTHPIHGFYNFGGETIRSLLERALDSLENGVLAGSHGTRATFALQIAVKDDRTRLHRADGEALDPDAWLGLKLSFGDRVKH